MHVLSRGIASVSVEGKKATPILLQPEVPCEIYHRIEQSSIHDRRRSKTRLRSELETTKKQGADQRSLYMQALRKKASARKTRHSRPPSQA